MRGILVSRWLGLGMLGKISRSCLSCEPAGQHEVNFLATLSDSALDSDRMPPRVTQEDASLPSLRRNDGSTTEISPGSL